MATYKGLPLFDMDLVDGICGVDIISLVDFPAVERNFIKFAKEVEVKFNVNDEKHIVTGPALIPGKKIYRRDESGYEYYVQFSKDAIKRIAEKFFEDHNTTNVNLQHELDVKGCVYFAIEGNLNVLEPQEPTLDTIDDLLSYLKGAISKNNI